MIALIQRVTEARVKVDGKNIGQIGRGILALVGVERGDGEVQAERLVEKVLGYRIFPDDAGKMNLSLLDIGGGCWSCRSSRWRRIRKRGRARGSPQRPRPRTGCGFSTYSWRFRGKKFLKQEPGSSGLT